MVLAYAKPIKGKKQEVVFCSPITVKKVGSHTVVGLIREFRWMASDRFGYLNNSNDIHVVTRDSHGKWSKTNDFIGITSPPVTHFTAVSRDSVVWKQSGALWTLDVSTGRTEEFWKPDTNRLISAYCSPENGKLIVSAQNKDKTHQILSLNPQRRYAYALSQVPLRSISKVNWANSGIGFAFQSPDHWGDSLLLRGSGTSPSVDLFTEGDVIDLRTRRSKVFVYGSEGNEPPGIWEYDYATVNTRSLVSSTEKPLAFATSVKHVSGTLTNNGRVLTYQVWSPPRSAGGRRRPLILGQTPYRWNAYPYIAAAASCHFVMVNRKSWEEGIETWESDVMAVYQEFANRKDVDPKRVYLYGHSAETVPISSLAASRPELWRGVIIPSPTELPVLAKCRLSSMLIDAGELDAGAQDRLTVYQSEAAKLGVNVKLVIHPKARHTSWSRATEQAKVEELASFLARN